MQLSLSSWRRVLFAVLLSWRAVSLAQPSPEVLAVPEEAIDRLFARWHSRTPGFVVGVVRKGQLVFARGYGMANLEHGVPITPRSRFYIASMSKQFTAACAALLAQRGAIRLDDPVRKYIPELRDYGFPAHPLTIDHLIHHTGGVREWSSLSLFAGQDDRFEQRLDNRDVLRMLLRQKSLEFEPGSHYRYSSGGYQLLTTIIERVSGKSLPEFAREEIFAPLGMNDSVFEDNYAALLPGRVESYRSLGNGTYEKVLKHFNVYGDGGMITTLEDLARWDTVFYGAGIGAGGLSQILLRQGRLNTGAELRYAFGLDVYTHKGHRVIEHGGGMLGFTVDMARFPDDHLTVIAMANTTEVRSTTMAFRVADLFLREASQPAPPADIHPVRLSAERLTSYTGYYWSAGLNFYRRIRFRDGRLMLDSGDGTMASELTPAGESEFVFASNPLRRVTFSRAKSGTTRIHVGRPEMGDGFVAERYDPAPPANLRDLIPLLGEYHSEELAATYRFWRQGERVLFQINDGKPKTIFPTPEKPMIWNSKSMLWTGFGEITFRRDSQGRVSGLTIGDQRVGHVLFSKLR